MMRDLLRSPVRPLRLLATLITLPALLTGCFPQQATPTRPRALPADSAAMLASAMRGARPAFPTQDEALRAGVYQEVALARPAAADRASPVAPPRTTPSPAPPASSPRTIPSPAPSPAQPPRFGQYVVQVAAFSDLASAQRAAIEARRTLPDLATHVEEQNGLFRVSVGSWSDTDTAEASLSRIRELYPSAWVRARAVP